MHVDLSAWAARSQPVPAARVGVPPLPPLSATDGVSGDTSNPSVLRIANQPPQPD